MAGRSSKSKPGINPVGRLLFWLAIIMFAGVGLAVLEGSQRLFELIAYPLIFLTSAIFLAWTCFAYKIGVVRVRTTTGRSYDVHRKIEPILFHVWIVSYLVFGIFMTALFAVLTFYDPNFLK